MIFSTLWLNELSRLVKQHPLLHKACLSRGGKNPCALIDGMTHKVHACISYAQFILLMDDIIHFAAHDNIPDYWRIDRQDRRDL